MLAPADVSTAAAGGLQYGLGRAHGEGRWLALSSRRVTLSSGRTRLVPFTVRVPRSAKPGDHFLSITAVDSHARALRPGQGGIRLRLIPRLAMTVEVRVPGPRTRSLGVGPISIVVQPSGASLALRLQSPGNALISSTTGQVSVSHEGSLLFGQPIELAAFVPKTAISLHVPWEGQPVEGTYRVTGTLRPQGARAVSFDRTVSFGGDAIKQFRRLTGRPAQAGSSTPLVLIVLLAVAFSAALIFGVAYWRVRRRVGGS